MGYARRLRARPLNPAQSIVLGFLLCVLAGTVLLMLPWAVRPGGECSFIDALFTATSSVCVTGLVVKSTGGDFTLFGQVVILALIQVGGLGYMTLASFAFLILGRRVSLRDRLILRDSLNVFSLEGISLFTGKIIKLTLIMEGAGTLVLALAWSGEHGASRAAYLALFHAVSSFNNAGFSLFDSSLSAYATNPFVTGTVMLLFVCGGLGFVVINEIFMRYRRMVPKLSLHSRIVLLGTAVLLGGGAALILGLEFANPATLGPLGWSGKVQSALFQAATPRTAGFNTVDIPSLMPGTMMLFLILMLVGASPGGTGGGIKTTTAAAIMALMISVFRGEEDVHFGQRRLARENVSRATFVFMAAGSYLILATFFLVLVEERSIFTLFFETVSAFGTVGLSLGDGGSLSFSSLLSISGKLIIIVTMFVGRIGLMTAGIAIMGKRPQALVRLPAERILIG